MSREWLKLNDAFGKALLSACRFIVGQVESTNNFNSERETLDKMGKISCWILLAVLLDTQKAYGCIHALL